MTFRAVSLVGHTTVTLKRKDSTADFSAVFSCNLHVQNEMLQIFLKKNYVLEMYPKSVKYTL